MAHIEQLPSGSYRFTAYDGGGKKKRLTWKPMQGLTARQLEKEIQKQAALFEEQVQTGNVADGNIRLSDYYALWMEQHARPQLAPKTVLEYEKLWTRIEQGLGHIRLNRIKPTHLQQFYVELQETAVNLKKGGRLSPTTINSYHRMLSSMFGYAVRMQLMTSNPCQRVRPPKKEQKEAATLSEDQAIRLLEGLEKEPLQFRVMVETLLYVGLRKSELHGLQWDDLDFSNGVLRIERELKYLQKQGLHVRPPKNASSVRAVKLPAGLIATLRYYKAWQNRQAQLVGDRWQESGWMFTDEFGNPRHPDSLPKQFKQFLARAGFTPEEIETIHLHTLRHSCATFLISANVDIRTVSNRLGHAQTNTTLNIYSHALRQADEAAAEALEFTLNRRKRA